MFKRLVSTALIFGAVALAPPAVAQTHVTCQPRDELTKTLQTRFGEHITGAGLQSETQVIEVWSSVETGSFTVLVTRPDGVSCVVATGQNWLSFSKLVELGAAG
jgi:hypothetical protein